MIEKEFEGKKYRIPTYEEFQNHLKGSLEETKKIRIDKLKPGMIASNTSKHFLLLNKMKCEKYPNDYRLVWASYIRPPVDIFVEIEDDSVLWNINFSPYPLAILYLKPKNLCPHCSVEYELVAMWLKCPECWYQPETF